MNPYDHVESEKTRIGKNINVLIHNNQNLCEHGGLHPMIARNGKYLPDSLYNLMKETFIKNWRY